ncbi:MAG: hypothetical protein M0036_02820 [Desulfobacteraceae bacterium]|nr:hypothetical protein [Desulfobacteraceae bacterium]
MNHAEKQFLPNRHFFQCSLSSEAPNARFGSRLHPRADGRDGAYRNYFHTNNNASSMFSGIE